MVIVGVILILSKVILGLIFSVSVDRYSIPVFFSRHDGNTSPLIGVASVSDSGFVVAWIKGYEPCGSIRIRILLILLAILLSIQYGTRYTTCEFTILDNTQAAKDSNS